jgi:gamma-glutamyltranspeptidase
MMVSFIQSNYHGFGSGIVIPKRASACKTAAMASNLIPGHPNVVAAASDRCIPFFQHLSQKMVHRS